MRDQCIWLSLLEVGSKDCSALKQPPGAYPDSDVQGFIGVDAQLELFVPNRIVFVALHAGLHFLRWGRLLMPTQRTPIQWPLREAIWYESGRGAFSTFPSKGLLISREALFIFLLLATPVSQGSSE